LIGGLLGWAWMRGTNLLREKVLVPFKLGPRHILKGFLGGLIIGGCGVLLPETLFWAEFEAQTIIDRGATPLPHVWPREGLFGTLPYEQPLVLLAIGLLKLFTISITVRAHASQPLSPSPAPCLCPRLLHAVPALSTASVHSVLTVA
jgi:H+/Cl- antiporter ClcA